MCLLGTFSSYQKLSDWKEGKPNREREDVFLAFYLRAPLWHLVHQKSEHRDLLLERDDFRLISQKIKKNNCKKTNVQMYQNILIYIEESMYKNSNFWYFDNVFIQHFTNEALICNEANLEEGGDVEDSKVQSDWGKVNLGEKNCRYIYSLYYA